MPDSFEAFIDDLQREIDEETRRIYSQEVFRRWKHPTHVGRMADAEACSRVRGSCGDTMEIYLRIRGNTIERASAFTDGCGCSMVCGSVVAEMAEGKTLEEAMDLRGDEVVEALHGLPDEDVHCAFLAADALREALHRYLQGIRERGVKGQIPTQQRGHHT
jgi:nitrogen fixation NifU-like protein